MRRRCPVSDYIEGALEWVLTGVEHRATEFIIVTLIIVALAYMTAAVISALS